MTYKGYPHAVGESHASCAHPWDFASCVPSQHNVPIGAKRRPEDHFKAKGRWKDPWAPQRGPTGTAWLPTGWHVLVCHQVMDDPRVAQGCPGVGMGHPNGARFCSRPMLARKRRILSCWDPTVLVWALAHLLQGNISSIFHNSPLHFASAYGPLENHAPPCALWHTVQESSSPHSGTTNSCQQAMGSHIDALMVEILVCAILSSKATKAVVQFIFD